MTDRTKGYMLGALSAASYGVNPFAVYMYDDGMSVDSVLFYRYAFAAVLLGGLMYARGESLRLSGKELLLLFVEGLIFSFSSITLFLAYQYIDVSIASTLLFCYPALVAIIMMLFFKEKPSVITVAAIVLVGIGIALLNSGGDGSVDNVIGVLLVVSSSLAYAIYIVSVQKTALARMSSLKVGFYSILFGSLIYIVRLDMCTSLQWLPTMRSGICAVVLAVFPTIISLTALAKSIKYIGSTAAAILGALEPVTAVLIGVIVFGERPTPLAILGMFIVFGAVTMLIAAPKISAALAKRNEKS